MGDGVDFFDREGAGRPEVIAALRSIEPPLDHPELLARLIDGHAGMDLNFRLFGKPGYVRALRAEMLDKLRNLKRSAAAFMRMQPADADTDVLSEVASGLIFDGAVRAVKSAAELIDAVERLAALDILVKADGGGPTVVDPAVQHVVDAVADYCGRVGIRFSGPPRRVQVGDDCPHLIKSAAAKLTAAVLQALQLNISPERLATHMARTIAQRSAK